jgi:sarcosine oxidase gamma subunit
VNELEFLDVDHTLPAWRSPLAAALAEAPTGIRDVTAEVDAAVEARLGPAAGLAGIELAGAHRRNLLRRLTDLNLDALPAIGPVASVRTLLVADGADSFRLWFAQEYSDHMVACVLDAAAGVRWV